MRVPVPSKVDAAIQDHPAHTGFLEGELLDLYGAILIAVPVAFFLKCLWT